MATTSDNESGSNTSPTLLARVPAVGKLLNDTSRPLAERFRALFTLRNIGGKEAIDAIARVFADPSALLKHECAYCLGQMQDKYALDVLNSVLRDEDQDNMVRHEAAEALGAIGDPSSVDILKEYLHHSAKEIAETCEIALDRIQWLTRTAEENTSDSAFHSVDPAPPAEPAPTEQLRATLLDTSIPLFMRYRALFALRNKNDEESVLAIVAGLEDESALFRHEIAYVLGQMQHPASVPGLAAALDGREDHPMVKHEILEALGSIATDETKPILEAHVHDKEPVVSESCVVALDMHEYENSEAFQYADAITRVEGE